MQTGAGESSKTDEPSNTVILRQLAAYLLPEDKPEYRWRIGGALALLVAAKGLNVAVRTSMPCLCTISKCSQYNLPRCMRGCLTRERCILQVPFMFKFAVDALTADPTGALAAGQLLPMVPAAALLGYGAARAGASLFNELRNAVFAKVGG